MHRLARLPAEGPRTQTVARCVCREGYTERPISRRRCRIAPLVAACCPMTPPPSKSSSKTRFDHHPSASCRSVRRIFRHRSLRVGFDEMFEPDGSVRGPYKGVYKALAPTSSADLAARADALGRAFIDQGVTFSLSGQERPFPLDLVPRVIAAQEWSRLEKGIKQRVKALELFLAGHLRRAANPARSRVAAPPGDLVRALPP